MIYFHLVSQNICQLFRMQTAYFCGMLHISANYRQQNNNLTHLTISGIFGWTQATHTPPQKPQKQPQTDNLNINSSHGSESDNNSRILPIHVHSKWMAPFQKLKAKCFYTKAKAKSSKSIHQVWRILTPTIPHTIQRANKQEIYENEYLVG